MIPGLYPVLATGLTAVACTSLALLGIHGLNGPTAVGQRPAGARSLGLIQLGLALMLTGEPARSYGLVLAAAGIGLAIWCFSRRPGAIPPLEGAASCAAC
jgi:hypothetical protein